MAGDQGEVHAAYLLAEADRRGVRIHLDALEQPRMVGTIHRLGPDFRAELLVYREIMVRQLRAAASAPKTTEPASPGGWEDAPDQLARRRAFAALSPADRNALRHAATTDPLAALVIEECDGVTDGVLIHAPDPIVQSALTPETPPTGVDFWLVPDVAARDRLSPEGLPVVLFAEADLLPDRLAWKNLLDVRAVMGSAATAIAHHGPEGPPAP
jgi:hypothetical protein